MEHVRYRLLGPMEITVSEQPVKLPGAAERALLVQLLLVPRRTIAATLLVDRLWAESTLPVDPMNALQIRVSKLRRAMKAMGLEDVVSRDGVGYRIDVDPAQVDALDFEARIRAARARTAAGQEDDNLREYDDALALWRGEPLSDFVTEQWATAAAARLKELRLIALTERAQVALSLGRHLEVAADLESLVAEDPTLESLAGLLMVALYRSGRQADALAVYTRTREVLDESLGLEPSVSLRSLQERVLRQDESLGAQPELSAPTPMPVMPQRSRGEGRVLTNLPAVVRPLIGRDTQLESMSGLLGQVRLLSLIGPGGAGKTSLALATAVGASSAYPDGAYAAHLASVDTGDQVPLAVADAVGMPMDGAAGDRDVRERLIDYLGRRRILLLVDNCEHVVDAAARLVDDILRRCPGVTVITTSRESLAVPDEVQVTVGPLEVPPDHEPAERILEYPASQLFAERARAIRPGLVFSADELLAIGRIVRALDGIPLAVELAAARVASMSASEIAERLGHRFALLTSGTRTAEARQQTLRATVDWSHDLLSDAERRVFARLSVFQGGWTLTAAEAVVGDDTLPVGQVLETIGRLVERSMVVVDLGPTTRYRMLETLRQYAGERLAASGDAESVARRHAEYFRGVAEKAEVELRGDGQRQALGLLREEQPNLRAAIAWFSRPAGDLDSALEMAGSLGMFWHLGRHLEGREVLARLVATGAGSSGPRARALQAVSLVERPRACLVHPSPRCAEAAGESLRIFTELGDTWHAALSKVLLAVEGVTGADRQHCDDLLDEAEEQFRRDGDAWGPAVIGFVRMETALKAGDVEVAVRVGHSTATAFRLLDDPWGLSATLYHLGWGLRQFGRFEEGARALEEAIDVAASAGLWNTVQWALADLAVEKVHLGELDTARELFDRSAAASQEVGDGAGEVLAGYGYGLLAQVGKDWGEAGLRYSAAVAGFQRLGTPVLVGVSLVGLARCAEADGEPAAAAARYTEALSIGRDLNEPSVTAPSLEGLARLKLTSGDEEQARVLLDEATAVRSRANRPAPPHERWDLEGSWRG